jgi:hypothetical protein
MTKGAADALTGMPRHFGGEEWKAPEEFSEGLCLPRLTEIFNNLQILHAR